MTEVKNPILLDGGLADESMLHPVKGTLKIQMNDVSEATLTLEDKAETIPMHRWVKIWNARGFVGCFRRTSRGRNIGTDNSYTLRHGIDILQDSVWNAEETFTGTKAELMAAILNKQTQLIQGPNDSEPRKPWALGSCADTSSVTKDINYDNLLDLMQDLVEEGGEYYFTYDQSVWPWTVSLVAKPSDVASEFRLDRNIEKCQINDNDSELCTRLILNVNKMQEDEDLTDLTGDDTEVEQNVSVYKTYNNTAAQAHYGIIVKTADIDVTQDTLPDGPFPEADAWAAAFLARRAEPLLQIEIDGEVLKGITGDDWDDAKIGTLVRVTLPDYATAISERCVTVNYPELYANSDKVTVSLANALPTYTSSFSATQKTVNNTVRSGRGTARKAESFDQHFEITDKAGNVLRQAGMHLDANGLLVYADDNENMVGSRFEVQAERIGMVVGHNSQGNFIKAAEIAVSINNAGEGVALISANHVNISATNTAHTLAGELEYDSQGRLVIKNAGGMYVRKTQAGVTSLFGVWDKGNLTGGVMVQQINGQTTTKIKGSLIQVDGDLVAGWLDAVSADMGNLSCTSLDVDEGATIEGTLSCEDIDAGDIGCGDIDCGSISSDSWIEAASFWLTSDSSHGATWQSETVVTSVSTSATHSFKYDDTVGGETVSGHVGGKLVTDKATTTIHYLGY